MSDGRRAFMMGNALVVGVVERIGTADQEGGESCLEERANRDVQQAGTDT